MSTKNPEQKETPKRPRDKKGASTSTKKRKLKQTRERLSEDTKFLRLMQRIAVASNQASLIDEAMQVCLDEICILTNWPVGHMYILAMDGTDDLVPSGLWHLDRPRKFNTFRQITECTRFAPGVGLPGRVMVTGKPAWITDVTKDPNFPRAKQAEDIGVKSAFAFPILVGSEVAAVLEFFTPETIEPSQKLLEIMAYVGAQLGRVIERKQAEEAFRKSEEKFHGMWESAPDAMVLVNTLGEIEIVNEQLESMTGYIREDLIGKPVEVLIPSRYKDHQRHMGEYFAKPYIRHMGKGLNLYLRRKDGSEFPVDICLSSLESGEVKTAMAIIRDITDLKQAEEALRMSRDKLECRVQERTAELQESEEQFRTLVNNIPGTVYRYFNQAGQWQLAVISDEIQNISGYPASEFMKDTGRSFESITHPDDNDLVIKELSNSIVNNKPYEIEYRILHANGEQRWVHEKGQPVFDEEDNPAYLDGAIFNITERKQAEERLRETHDELAKNQRLLQSVMDYSPALISIKDLEGRFILADHQWLELMDLSEEDVIGHTDFEFYPEDLAHRFKAEDRKTLELGDVLKKEETVPMAGVVHTFSVYNFPLFDESGHPFALCNISTDITERKQAEDKIRHLANHDELTGLPTLRLGKDRLLSAIALARRNKSSVALLFLDLDGFKAVNDGMGHKAGDQVLKEVAKRLTHSIRDTDTVARIGGDEFVIILTQVGDNTAPAKIAKKVIDALAMCIEIDDQDVYIGTSIGIALYPIHGETSDELIKKADEAMYMVKHKGKNNYAIARG
jgi:diguanylate cyclase (GGDEF)-like protein/PAS domain S-box-containing protein